MKLIPLVAKQLAHTRIMEKQAALLIDDVEAGGAVFENIEELALAFDKLGGTRGCPAFGSAQVVGHFGS